MSDLLDEAHEFLLCMDKMEYADALFALRAELTEARRQLAAQPAVPEAVASDADWNHVPVGRVIGDPVWAGQLWRSQIQGTKKLRHGDLVYIRLAAILSATDSEVKK